MKPRTHLNAALLAALLLSCPFFLAAEDSSSPPAPVVEAEEAFPNDAYNDLYDDPFEDDLYGEEAEHLIIWDPIEPFNRLVFRFNHQFYRALRPVSNTYQKVVPRPAKTAVGNFFHNIRFPIRFVNFLLQGDPRSSGLETARFALDSTIGFGGLLRPSAEFPGLKTDEVDLGITFGAWGFGNGFYLVLPILGPSSLRDTIGIVGDSFLNPTLLIDEHELRIALNTLNVVDSSHAWLHPYFALVGTTVDPYTSLKDIYIHNRSQRVSTRSDQPFYQIITRWDWF